MDSKRVAELILEQVSQRAKASRLHREHKDAEEAAGDAAKEISGLLRGFFEKNAILRFEVDGRLFTVEMSGNVLERTYEKLDARVAE